MSGSLAPNAATWAFPSSRVLRNQDVPLTPELGVLGKKWTFLIMRRVAVGGQMSFGQLLHVDQRLSRRILSFRLKELKFHGYLRKTLTDGYPFRAVYELTEKGRATLPFILAFSELLQRYGVDGRVSPPPVSPASMPDC